MNAEFNTKDSLYRLKIYELYYTRVVCVAAILLYPISGFILRGFDSSAVENIPQRLVLSGLFLFILLGSFKFEHIKKNAVYYLYPVMFIAIIWSFWITSVNDFNSNYSLILLTGIAATASLILHRNLIIFFLLVTSIALYLYISFTANGELSPMVLPLSTIILFAVYIIREHFRKQIVNEVESLNKRLVKANTNLEEKVIERTKMLELKNDELEKLTYIVSHDLKSPLRNIGSFASLIDKKIEKEDYESVKSYSAIISKGVKRMTTIISDLLEYGSIDQTEDQFADINLPSLVHDIIDTDFNGNLYSNVRFDVASDFPDIIHCDAIKISLLVENLIGNGIKYNDSTLKFIRVYYKSEDNFHKIFVKDNGIGISEKYKEKIFEMFSRLHSDSKYDGTGIGLSICRKIVNNHGGKINFSSEHGEGTTFYFTISKTLHEKPAEKKTEAKVAK